MRTVILDTNLGSVPFSYTISTPTIDDADQIDSTLPTILFLHPGYNSSEAMHPQFSDPELRAFNLIAMDARGWGLSHPDIGPTYNQHEAAEDIFQFTTVLNLPPLFIAGVSMGTIGGFQFAVSHPDRVRGVFLASHLCLAEIPGVSEGRQEIYDLWNLGAATNNKELVEECILGSHQLAFNNIYTNFTSALLRVAINLSTRPEREAHREKSDQLLLVDYYGNRTPYSQGQLARLASASVPVCVVAGGQDVAYPVDYSEALVEDLTAAGVSADLYVVEGAPDFFNITHHVEFNAVLRDFVRANLPADTPVPPTPDPSSIASPFLPVLIKAGLQPGEEYEPEDKPIADP